MSERKVLFSIVESNRDGIGYSVTGSERANVLDNKDEILSTLEKLKTAIINETYPFSSMRPGWKKHVTRSMVACKACEKVISISTSSRIESNSKTVSDTIVIATTSERERTYYQKGNKRLCVDCYERGI